MTLYSSNPVTAEYAPKASNDVSLGVQFRVTEAGCTLKAVRFYLGATVWGHQAQGALYEVGGTAPISSVVSLVDPDVAAPAASSETNGEQYDSRKAFDGNTGTWWLGTPPTPEVPAWLAYNNLAADVITEYRILSHGTALDTAPKDWTFEGSNDGTTWTVLDTQTGITWATAGEKAYPLPSNATAYLRHRLHITAHGGNATYISVRELTLVGLNVAPSPPRWAVGEFAAPPALTPGVDYRAVIYFPNGYAPNSPGPFVDELVSGPLVVVSDANSANGNHTYAYATGITNPTVNYPSADNYMLDVVVEQNLSPESLAVLPVSLPVGFVTEPTETTVELALGVGLEAVLGSPEAGVELPATVGFEADTATSVEASIGVGLQAAPATEVPLPVGVTIAFDASQPGTTEFALPVAADLAFDVFAAVELPVAVGFVADIVPAQTTVDIPVAVGLAFAAELVVPPSLELPIGVGLSFFVATRGSLWLPYAVAESGSQLMDFSIVPTSPEFTAPTVVAGDPDSNSLWLELTSSAAQTLSVSLAGVTGGIELWAAEVDEGPDEIVYMASGGASASLDVSAGQRILIRVHPTSAAYVGTGTLTWSVAARPESGLLAFTGQAELLETPGWLTAEVASASAGAQLDFTVDSDPTVVFSATADDLGLFAGGVWIPELSAGSHTLTVVDSLSGQSGSLVFGVSLEVPAPSGGIPGGTPPAPLEVTRWEFVDPSVGGEVFSFPINPSSMSTPNPTRPLTSEHTVYPGGQALMWEGLAEPVSWQVEGSVLTQGHYEALERFHALQRRFWVTDHLSRSWVVAFEGLQFRKMRDPENPWAHAYTAKFLIVGGPVIHP